MDPRQSHLHSSQLQKQLMLGSCREHCSWEEFHVSLIFSLFFSNFNYHSERHKKKIKNLSPALLMVADSSFKWRGEGEALKINEAKNDTTAQHEELEWCQEEYRWNSGRRASFCSGPQSVQIHTCLLPWCFACKVIPAVWGRCGLHWEMPKSLLKSLLHFKG